MKKNLLLLAFLSLAITGAFAQQYRLTGVQVPNFRNDALEKTFERYTVFSIEVEPLLQLAAARPSSLDLRLEFGEIASARFQLKPSQVLAEGYQTFVSGESGMQALRERPAVYPFRTATEAGASAALTVASAFLYGSFEANGHDYFVEPLWYFDALQPHDLVVVYDASDVKERHESICGTEEVEQQERELVAQEGSAPNENCGPPQFLDLAIANDYQMVTKFGSVANVITHNIATMNAVQANWDDEFVLPVTIQILTQFVPSSPAGDPFTTSNSRDVIFASLIDWALAGGFGTMDFDLAHWRSPRTIYNPNNQQIYGAAYQNGLCGFNTRFGIFSEVNALPACGLRTVTSHEMGHSFGCPHTTGIMASPYGGCTNLWDATDIGIINARIPNSLCLGLSPSCPIPNSIIVPPNLAFICTGIEECFTYTDNLCVGSFSVSTNDPYLQITVWGTTICMLSTQAQSRIATVVATPLDYCGNPANNPQEPSGIWQIRIDWAGQECMGLHGNSEDRLQQVSIPEDLKIASSNDFVRIEDFATDLRSKEVRLFDQMGRQLLHQRSGDSVIQIPLSDYPSGIFVVQVTAGDKVLTKKITHF
jgi:Metallo-peptidase family M12B Reprolysin-like